MLGKPKTVTITTCKGAVATSTVLLLTVLLSGALLHAFHMITSLSQQAHYHRKYFTVLDNLTYDLSTAADGLRQTNMEELILPATTEISETPLMGINHTPLTHFTISASSTELPLSISQDYIRYPALLNLPSQSMTDKPQKDLSSLIKTLFNREVSDFSPYYFPEVDTHTPCDTHLTSKVIWRFGSCVLTLNQDLGSSTDPTFIVIEEGDLVIRGKGTLWGLVLLLERGNTRPPRIDLNIGTKVNGAVISNSTHSVVQNGEIVFNDLVLKRLQVSPFMTKVIAVPGTWRYDINE